MLRVNQARTLSISDGSKNVRDRQGILVPRLPLALSDEGKREAIALITPSLCIV